MWLATDIAPEHQQGGPELIAFGLACIVPPRPRLGFSIWRSRVSASLAKYTGGRVQHVVIGAGLWKPVWPDILDVDMHRDRTGNSGPQVLDVLAQHFQLIAAQSLTGDRPLRKNTRSPRTP